MANLIKVKYYYWGGEFKGVSTHLTIKNAEKAISKRLKKFGWIGVIQ